MLSPKRRPRERTDRHRDYANHPQRNIALFHGQEEASELPARTYKQSPFAIPHPSTEGGIKQKSARPQTTFSLNIRI